MVPGTSAAQVSISISGRFPEVGVIGSYSVNVMLGEQLEELAS